MKDLVAPNIDRLIPYSPGKPVEELERELGIQNAVKLASNESPMGPSPKVREAIAQATESANRYPDAAAWSLRQALAKHHDVPMEELCVGNGSNELIDLLCLTFGSPEEHAVFGDPSFVCYWLGCTAAGVPFTKVPLDDHISWNVDRLLEAVRPETKLLFLANPNNPTGAYVGRQELERLLRELPENVIAVLDEAYFAFADADDYTSALEMRKLHERLVVLRTFSKVGLAGLRVGYAIAPPPIIEYLNRVRAPFNVNSIAQRAALATLEDPEHIRQYVEMNRTERARVTEELGKMGLRVAPSQANFVLVDFEQPGPDVYDALLRKGVIVRPMPAPIDTWQRITIGLPEENERLFAAVREFLGAS
jgi:histidinol-phosphate aminotransferase